MKNEIIVGVLTAVATAGILAASEASFGWISSALNNDPLPSGMIVMADRECAALEGSWSVYSDAGGRFPIAAGGATDANGERRQFSVGHTDDIGTYRHRLTIEEIPSHDHSAGQFNLLVTRDGKLVAEHAVPQNIDINARKGEPIQRAGSDQPHNNIPPYIALNFCIKL